MTKFLFFCALLCSSFLYGQESQIKISPDIYLIRLSKDCYMHVSVSEVPGFGRVSSNGLVYSNKGEALLFDTPSNDSLTQMLVSWLRDSMKLKIAGFIPNHWHSDCMGGLRYLKSQGIRTYANKLTIDIASKKNLPVPDSSFQDSLQLILGDKIILCYYPGPAHTLDNIVVWIPSEKILFAGCMIKSIISNNLGNLSDGDLIAYPKTLGFVKKKFADARIIIPGHGEPGGFSLISHTQDLLDRNELP